MEGVFTGNDLGLEALRANLRALAAEREYERTLTERNSAAVAQLARLSVHTPLSLADAAREAGVSRQSLHEAAKRAPAVAQGDRLDFALIYLASAGAVQTGELARVLGLEDGAGQELLAELRAEGLSTEMGGTSGASEVRYVALSAVGESRLQRSLQRLTGYAPARTHAVFFEVEPAERAALERAAGIVIGATRWNSWGPELTPVTQGVQGPEIGLAVNTGDYAIAVQIALDLWRQLRVVADLAADTPPVRITISAPAG